MSMKESARITVGALAVVLCGSLAHAQATRTWVSGVGDDANPCSRTAPCKTFAGAISKTALGGEIDALDPGGFGAVTITKSITIAGDGTLGSILASGTQGIIISSTAAATTVVRLRNLSINGAGTPEVSGINGIRMLGGAALHVENCAIFNFTQQGIDAESNVAGAKLFVKDTTINHVGDAGILIKPVAPGTISAALDNVRLEGNQVGLRVEDNGNATVSDSYISGNNTNGVNAVSTAAAVNVMVTRSTIANNVNNGLRSSGGLATIFFSSSTITRNGTGITTVGGALLSLGNNTNVGNTAANGAPTATLPPQ
jgi:hypothetical protein